MRNQQPKPNYSSAFAVGAEFTHTNGETYVIESIPYCWDTMCFFVVFRNVRDGVLWTRTLAKLGRSITFPKGSRTVKLRHLDVNGQAVFSTVEMRDLSVGDAYVMYEPDGIPLLPIGHVYVATGDSQYDPIRGAWGIQSIEKSEADL